MPPENAEDTTIIEHTAIGILLRPANVEPSSVNPDFLRFNRISEADWVVEPPVILEPGLSRVRYDNGVVVTATRDQVTFAQTKRPLQSQDIVCPPMAIRFLSIMPRRAEYRTVGIDPVGRIRLPEANMHTHQTTLASLGQKFPYKDAFPRVQARFSYNLDDRVITLYVGEREGDGGDLLPEFRFSAHIHRDVPSSDQPEQLEFVRSQLESWEDDLADFDRLAIQFYLESISGT